MERVDHYSGPQINVPENYFSYFLIKHMLWVLKGKKIIAILRFKILLNWSYDYLCNLLQYGIAYDHSTINLGPTYNNLPNKGTSSKGTPWPFH